MKKTIELLEEVKARYGLKSNYALAKKLGQTDTDIARWMKGKNTLGDDAAMQVADLLDLDPAYVVACMHAERAKHESERKLWERIASMAVAASVVGLVAGLALILSGGAISPEGLSYGAFAVTSDLSGLYIMRELDALSALNWALFAAFLVTLLLSLRDYHLTKKTTPRQEAHYPEV